MKKKPAKRFRLAYFLAGLVWLVVVAALAGGVVFWHFTRDLPRLSSIRDYRPKVVTQVFAENGELIGEFFIERRFVIPIESVPHHVINAFIAAEDANFFKHEGIDLKSILRAFLKNLRAGEMVQGGSTITQQVVKSLLLTPAKSLRRKAREAILAWRIEKSFSKKEILYLYLNQIYLGAGAYGVQSASQVYFGKDVQDITLEEAALLAGLTQAPSRTSPFNHPDRALERRRYVLQRMVQEGFLNEVDAEWARVSSMVLSPWTNPSRTKAPYFVEHIRRMVEERYGSKALYEEGLRIETTLNAEMQNHADRALREGLRSLDKRQGYRGPLRRLLFDEAERFTRDARARFSLEPLSTGELFEGVVVGVESEEGSLEKSYVEIEYGDAMPARITLDRIEWALGPDDECPFRPGDVVSLRLLDPDEEGGAPYIELDQEPIAQGALLGMDVDTGFVRAMTGGYDFEKSEFNRAIQARRQPGSAFKPIIYAAALDKGYTPATRLIDAPLVWNAPELGQKWKPENFDNRFLGPVTLREALTHSRNVVTIKILKDIGVRYAADYAERLGITSPLTLDLSMALGSSSVSLLELTRAYGIFASGGSLVEPIFIRRIQDHNGNTIDESEPVSRNVISPETAYLITNLLTGVVREGTGRRVRSLGRPCAGKTGTTNKFVDAWFIGFTPELTTGVWVGFDQDRSLGLKETGSRAACPVWLDFMKNALAHMPKKDFPMPPGIEKVKIDNATGLLARPDSETASFECFRANTAPTTYSPDDKSLVYEEDFFKSDHEMRDEGVEDFPIESPLMEDLVPIHSTEDALYESPSRGGTAVRPASSSGNSSHDQREDHP